MKHKGAIILGGHIQALGIIRILGRMGVNCIVIDNTAKNISRHSKYCTLFIKTNNAYLLQTLIDLGQIEKYQGWILFPTNDFHVKLLSINKTLLEKHFTVSVEKWDIINTFYNKCNAYKLAQKIGLPIPRTSFPLSEDDLAQLEIGFPCILKPAVMHEFYSKTRKKVFICQDAKELLISYKKALSLIPNDEIIIQEIIPGSSENQFSACFLILNGRVFVSLTACRLRQHPIDFGNATTYAETVDLPEVKEYAEKILKASKYSGLCEVEFKKDERDGTFKFLEVNPRTWKWHSIANKAGTPFIQMYYDYLCGLSITPHTGYNKASFVHFITDFPIRLQLAFKGYKHWINFQKPVESATWASDDIMPWFFEKLYLIYMLKSR